MAFLERAYETVRTCMGANGSEVQLWKIDHENAMQVFDCEALVGHQCESFDRIEALHRSFVDQVVSGSMPYQEALETKIKELWKDWQAQAVDVMNTVEIHQNSGYRVENRKELQDRVNKAAESSKLNFDIYALEKLDAIRLPIDKLRAFQTPVMQWRT